jgi:large conductance mechanosensitive channel
LKEFKEFINRGNLVDLAVAFVLGTAFAALVASFVDDILMQVVAMIFGEPDFSGLTFTINDAVFRYGAFLNAVITFIAVAGALFVVVKSYNRFRRQEPAGPTEVDLLTEIRDSLRSR